MKKSFLSQSFNTLKRVGQTASVASLSAMRIAQGDKLDAQMLKENFEQLGATYIKIGQFIASTPSLFPREYVEAFQGTLDQTTPLSYAYIESVLREELEKDGKKLEAIFSHIDKSPLASASIAQVHAATLKSGENVVLKVQKPNVATVINTDLGVLYGLSKILEKLTPSMKFASLAPLVDEIRLRMMAETDFYQEAQNIADFQQFLQQNHITQVVAPKVYAEFSTKKVLTMERFFGVSMIDVTAMRRYCDDPAQVMADTLNTWFASVMTATSFHADLHAGNLMLLEDGRIGFIDFGIVGKLEPVAWRACMDVMDSFGREDYDGMARAMIAMGMTHGQGKVDVNVLAQDLRSMMGKILAEENQFIGKTLNDPSLVRDHADDLNKMMLELVDVGKRHGLHFPRDFVLLTKQMLYFDRFMKTLAPDMDMFNDRRIHMAE